MTVYAAPTDVFNIAIPQQAVAQLTAAQQNQCCQAASDTCDDHFRGRWGYDAVPLLQWDQSVTLASARIAAFLMVNVRGYRGDASADKLFKTFYDIAMDWLGAVQRQQSHPLVTLANNMSVGGAQPIVTSFSVVDLSTGATASSRGW